MNIKQFQVHAFTNRLFSGNAAAVCPLKDWPDDSLLQAVATENNLPETAFFVPHGMDFQLRWFTATHEIERCGHATLASAHVLFNQLEFPGDTVRFLTHSGPLVVEKQGTALAIDLPARPPQPCAPPDGLMEALGVEPLEVLAADDYMAVLPDEASVRNITPDLVRVRQLDRPGLIVTAKGDTVDMVSRYFAPTLGIAEDSVTAPAHCTLAPYWAERLGRKRLHACQLSRRGGELHCEAADDRVRLIGSAITFMEGVIRLP